MALPYASSRAELVETQYLSHQGWKNNSLTCAADTNKPLGTTRDDDPQLIPCRPWPQAKAQSCGPREWKHYDPRPSTRETSLINRLRDDVK